MGMATGSRVPSGRFAAATRLGGYFVEEEVARGPASLVLAGRPAPGSGSASLAPERVAIKSWDPSLRLLTEGAARFEAALDPRIARVRRADETGELPRERLYRVMDLVRGEPASLAALGSLRSLIAFWAAAARALGVAHARGAAHGYVRPAHVLACDGRPYVVDAGVAPTPSAAQTDPRVALVLSPEAVEDLLAGRAPRAEAVSDVYSIAASIVLSLGGPAPGVRGAVGLGSLAEAKRRGVAPVIAATSIPRAAVDQRALGALLARALDPDPKRRPADGAALALELGKTLEPLPPKNPEESP